MATLFSHGATHLLCGEADRILVDPYYVRNHAAGTSTADLLKRWYDFLVEHVELLCDPGLHDMTGALAGDYNGDCDVSYDTAAVTESPAAGAVWRRILGSGDRLIVHLINLTDQEDTEWDAPRRPVTGLPAARSASGAAGPACRACGRPTRTAGRRWPTSMCTPTATMPSPSCRPHASGSCWSSTCNHSRAATTVTATEGAA